jgi:CxxC-x17-CxxC domain-containing protein
MRQATADTAPELEGRELLRRYGRDPRRPDWVDAEHGIAAATAPRDTGSSGGTAPERRARRRHQSVCATCGETAETSFRPDPTRPVYCDGCYQEVRETRRAAVAAPVV